VTGKLAVAGFLPDVELPSSPAGTPLPLRPAMGRTTVLVCVHSAGCEGCLRYLDGLNASGAEFEAWDARLLVAAPGPPAAARFGPSFAVILADPTHIVTSPSDAAVTVADRYGHIFEACHAGESHRLPSPRELEEWIKFLGTLCPE
jgi:hypothetical protein